MNKSSNLNNYFINYTKILFLILVLAPKFTFIRFPGSWHGIRIDEIIILLIVYIFLKKNMTLNFDHVGKSFFIFFLYFIFSSIVGYSNNVEINLFFFIRYIEYIVILLLFNFSKLDKIFVLRLFQTCILINFVVVILQSQDVIGVISSKGYFPTMPFGVPYGIFGGAWEINACIGISYFIVASLTKNRILKLVYLAAVFYIVYVSGVKGGFFAFIIGLIFFELNADKKFFFRILFVLILIPVFFIISKFLDYQLFKNLYLDSPDNLPLLDKILMIDYKFLLKSLYEFIFFQKPILMSELPSNELLSIKFRIDNWLKLYDIYLTNFYTILFGTGYGPLIYIESLILRIIFSFGIMGTILIVYFMRSVPIYIFSYVLFLAVALDFLSSIKIFIFLTFLFYTHKVLLKK